MLGTKVISAIDCINYLEKLTASEFAESYHVVNYQQRRLRYNIYDTTKRFTRFKSS